MVMVYLLTGLFICAIAGAIGLILMIAHVDRWRDD